MITIWKYEIPDDDFASMTMPKGARILSVGTQNNVAFVWALADTSSPVVSRRIAVRGTGHRCDGLSFAQFIGTFQIDGGALIFHVFDLGESTEL